MKEQTIQDVAMIARNAIDKIIELERLNKQPTELMAIPTLMEAAGWVRVEKLREEYERGVIDGMQKQMQSSVDRAVNAMGKKKWVGLTDEEIKEFRDAYDIASSDYLKEIEAKLKEKNT